MAKEDITFSPAEFRQLPLDYIISAPLTGVINAQKIASLTTLEFVMKLAKEGNQEFSRTISQKVGGAANAKDVTRKISVPLLALTKVPSMNFDSLSIDFEYSISQVASETKERTASLDLNVKGSKWLSAFVDIGLKGSISSTKSTENTINKSGTLKIKLHASETEAPEGLSKVINWLTQGIENEVDEK